MSEPTRVAAIDCGTNTIRLLIADVADTRLVEVDRQLRYVRLGQDVDRTGEFHPDALARTFAACEEYAAVIAGAGVTRTRFVATSAARDVGNRDLFLTGVADRLGVTVEIIAGAEEAELSFLGAVTGVGDRLTGDPVLVMDIGGGSTELVLGDRASGPTQAVSLDLGSVRLTERLLRSDPPTAHELQAACDLVDAQIEGCGIDLAAARSFVGVAGTVTTLSAIEQGLTSYDRSRVHGSVVDRDAVAAWFDWFAGSTAADRAELACLPPQRADVITAGVLIAERIGAFVPADLVVSESDILDGVALRLGR